MKAEEKITSEGTEYIDSVYFAIVNAILKQSHETEVYGTQEIIEQVNFPERDVREALDELHRNGTLEKKEIGGLYVWWPAHDWQIPFHRDKARDSARYLTTLELSRNQ